MGKYRVILLITTIIALVVGGILSIQPQVTEKQKLISENSVNEDKLFGASSIAHDATSSNIGTATNTRTVSHTIATGSDISLWVTVTYESNNSVTSVKWNGTETMTQAVSVFARGRRAYIYYLASPTTGTHDVVVTLNGSAGAVGTSVTSYTGTDTSDPLGATASGSVDNKTGITVTTATDTDDSWLITALSYENGIGTPSLDSPSTERVNNSSSGNRHVMGDRTTGTSGNFDVDYSWSAFINQEGNVAVAEIHQAPVSGGTTETTNQSVIWFN